jgi:hypothetical protein
MTPKQAEKLSELQLKNYLSMILLSHEVMAEEDIIRAESKD